MFLQRHYEGMKGNFKIAQETHIETPKSKKAIPCAFKKRRFGFGQKKMETKTRPEQEGTTETERNPPGLESSTFRHGLLTRLINNQQ